MMMMMMMMIIIKNDDDEITRCIHWIRFFLFLPLSVSEKTMGRMKGVRDL